MIQDVIVFAITALAVFYIARRMVKKYKKKSDCDLPTCGGCNNVDCQLRKFKK